MGHDRSTPPRADGPFGGHLSQGQVAGIKVLLAAMTRLPISYTAYLLATACHETARIFCHLAYPFLVSELTAC